MEKFGEDIRRLCGPGIEVEVRLGKMSNGMFDTNLGQTLFKRLVRSLEKYQKWENVTEVDDEVFYWHDGIRCIYGENGSCVYEKKTPIIKKDLSLKKMDCRLAISKETQIQPVSGDATRSVSRHRKSFLRKNVRIDCTIVSGDSEDKDCEDQDRYQIELEFLDVSSDQLIFSALHKVKDLIECV